MARKIAKGNLTDTIVKTHVYTPGKSPFLWDRGDNSCTGFAVRATPAGGKQYVIQYRHARRLRRMSLGSIDNWPSVDEAREHARMLLRRHQSGNIDPAVGGDGTMSAVMTHYIKGLKNGSARRRMKGHPASESTVEAVESAWKTHLEGPLGKLPPKEVTGALIRDLHARITASRKVTVEGRGGRQRGGLYVANRTMAYLAAAWKASALDGLTAGLPDPFSGLTRNHERARTEYLRKSDLPKFLKAVESEPEPFRSYWKLMLYLGNRGGELRKLLWEDVDLEQGIAVFKDTKNHTEHEVPLPPEAIEILRALPQSHSRVFTFTRPKTSWGRIRVATGLRRLRPHDVRRSVGTWLGAAGLSSKQVGALLNHKSDITSRVYMQLSADTETKRSAAALQAELVKKFGGNVISLAEAREQRNAEKSDEQRAAS
jgi:integrase